MVGILITVFLLFFPASAYAGCSAMLISDPGIFIITFPVLAVVCLYGSYWSNKKWLGMEKTDRDYKSVRANAVAGFWASFFCLGVAYFSFSVSPEAQHLPCCKASEIHAAKVCTTADTCTAQREDYSCNDAGCFQCDKRACNVCGQSGLPLSPPDFEERLKAVLNPSRLRPETYSSDDDGN